MGIVRPDCCGIGSCMVDHRADETEPNSKMGLRCAACLPDRLVSIHVHDHITDGTECPRSAPRFGNTNWNRIPIHLDYDEHHLHLVSFAPQLP